MSKTTNQKSFTIAFTIIVIIFSYMCSRGTDGRLILGLTLHFLLCVGMALQSIRTRARFKEQLVYSLIYAIGSFLGVWLNSELDEMAGALFIFYPSFAGVYLILAVTISLFRNKAKASADDKA